MIKIPDTYEAFATGPPKGDKLTKRQLNAIDKKAVHPLFKQFGEKYEALRRSAIQTRTGTRGSARNERL